MDLAAFFQKHPKTAVAFSGGADSAFLLYAAVTYGTETKAYFVKSAFQPRFELEDAKRMAACLRADLAVLEADLLCEPEITDNSAKRCYYCKKAIVTRILTAAAEDGFPVVLDGTNASDQADDRPGMQALIECSIRSPLRECGLTKADIRQLSKEAGLFTWNKPAYACLATRIPAGSAITAEKLERTEYAEHVLSSLGLTDFRVRLFGDAAKIQVPITQLDTVLANRTRIVTELKPLYSDVLLDLEVRA